MLLLLLLQCRHTILKLTGLGDAHSLVDIESRECAFQHNIVANELLHLKVWCLVTLGTR